MTAVSGISEALLTALLDVSRLPGSAYGSVDFGAKLGVRPVGKNAARSLIREANQPTDGRGAKNGKARFAANVAESFACLANRQEKRLPLRTENGRPVMALDRLGTEDVMAGFGRPVGANATGARAYLSESRSFGRDIAAADAEARKAAETRQAASVKRQAAAKRQAAKSGKPAAKRGKAAAK